MNNGMNIKNKEEDKQLIEILIKTMIFNIN